MPPSAQPKCKAKYSVPGTSRMATITIGRKRSVVRVKDLKQKECEAFSQCNTFLQSIDIHQREQFLQAEEAARPGDTSSDIHFLQDMDCHINITSALPHVGSEGIKISQEGGEFELYSELSNILSGSRQQYDDHDHTNRIAEMAAAWASQYNDLTDAYLLHKSETARPSTTEDLESFEVEVVNIFNHSVWKIPQQSIHLNVSLMHCRCISASPIKPTVAITLRTLEVYCQTHQVCPRLSIHAEVKKLCHMHHVCYHRHLAEQFRGRIHPIGTCPACHYIVDDEPTMQFMFLVSMDGNNSAKLVDPILRRGNE
ncbi:hypothetical protein BDR07DRAFT_1502794 [Suillus spraguei]|nr:hypothetical protein BDR07DRAFT_1502794 [Suillus spraguei]